MSWRVRHQTLGRIGVGMLKAGGIGYIGYDCSQHLAGGITYPIGSILRYGGADLWVGAVKRGDTLVSTTWGPTPFDTRYGPVRAFWSPAIPA